MMLTDRMRELETEYGELFIRERDLGNPDPKSIQAKRQRFIDYLFDEVLSQEDIFESFSAVGSIEHEEDGLVLTYQSQPGYARTQEEAGIISHYQFMAFQQRTAFPWLPDFLILRDRDTSEVKLYVVSNGLANTPPTKIGVNDDLELTYEMPYIGRSGSGLVVDRGGMEIKEVSRSQLCDPHYVFVMTVGGKEGMIFQAFYYGLQEFAKTNLQRIDSLKGALDPDEVDRAYHALQAIVRKS